MYSVLYVLFVFVIVLHILCEVHVIYIYGMEARPKLLILTEREERRGKGTTCGRVLYAKNMKSIYVLDSSNDFHIRMTVSLVSATLPGSGPFIPIFSPPHFCSMYKGNI